MISEQGRKYIESGEKNKAFELFYKAPTVNEDYEIIKNLQLLDLYTQINKKKPFLEANVISMLKQCNNLFWINDNIEE